MTEPAPETTRMGYPRASQFTPTQEAVQRLTASIQGETTLGLAARLDAFVAEHMWETDRGSDVVDVSTLAAFYSGLVREGEALRRIASGA